MTPLERVAYLAHSKNPFFERKVTETIRFINDYPNYCVSVSWGKDSVVLLHLVTQVLTAEKTRAINARYPNPAERLADMDKVRDELLNRSDMQGISYQEVNTPGEWEMYDRVGYAFPDANNKEEKAAAKWWKENFTKNMAEAAKQLDCTGHFLGLCADESRGRRMNVRVHGQSYIRKDGIAIALPLSFWNPKDIWAYHAKHNLPYLKIYDTSPRGREKARSGFVFATTGTDDYIHSQGVWREWLDTYPTEFNQWLNHFPELRERMIN